MLWEYKGDRGIRQARKHMTWYAKGFPGAAELRGQLCNIETVEQGCALIDRALEHIAITADSDINGFSGLAANVESESLAVVG
jgi:tRNA-dihydrouridine synthase